MLPIFGGNRELKERVRTTYAQTAEAQMRVDGAFKVAGRMMDRIMELDEHRRELAKDELTNQLLGQIEMACLDTYRRIQRNLYEE